MDSVCRAPSGSDRLAGLYCVGLCLCEERYAKYNRHNDRKNMFDGNVYSQFTLLMRNRDSKWLHNVCQNNCSVRQCFRIIVILFIVSKDYLISSYVLPSLMAGIWMLRRLRRSKTCEKDVQKNASSRELCPLR